MRDWNQMDPEDFGATSGTQLGLDLGESDRHGTPTLFGDDEDEEA